MRNSAAGSILRSQRMEELSSLRSWVGQDLSRHSPTVLGGEIGIGIGGGSCAREQQLFGDKYLAMNM